MAGNVYGMDIGTGNFKMCYGEHILNEHNVIAVTKKDIVAFGDEAYEMYEKAPANIKIIFPVKDGVIADIENMQSLFQKFFLKINGGKRRIGAADFVIAVPTDVTEVEKRAFFELAVRTKLKTKNITVVDKPIADAIGAGLDVTRSKGIMIVNIGTQTCEISVLSFGGIVLSKSIKIGGSKIDENIISAVRKEYNLVIGKKSAEKLKMDFGCAGEPDRDDFALGFGRNVLSGLPVSSKISPEVICNAMEEPLRTVVEQIRIMLEKMPPEFAPDILTSGIYITGGSAAIRNLQEYLSKETELKICIVSKPQESIIRGIQTIVSTPELSRFAYVPD